MTPICPFDSCRTEAMFYLKLTGRKAGYNNVLKSEAALISFRLLRLKPLRALALLKKRYQG